MAARLCLLAFLAQNAALTLHGWQIAAATNDSAAREARAGLCTPASRDHFAPATPRAGPDDRLRPRQGFALDQSAPPRAVLGPMACLSAEPTVPALTLLPTGPGARAPPLAA